MREPSRVRAKVLALALAALVLSVPAPALLRAEVNAQAGLQPQSLRTRAERLEARVRPLPTEADKVHVVLLVFGNKGGISAACQKDCKGLRAALETAFADDAERLVFYDLTAKNPKTGKVYTRDETLAVIKGLEVGPNDNVLVFQSGHGAIGNRNDPEMSHQLMMDGCTLTRAQVQRPIEARKPRGILFLTDCCSGISKRPAPVSTPEFVSLVGPNVETIRNLVLRPAGIVSITAADDGKLASASFRGANPGKAGSAFTVALLRLWYSDTTYDSWPQFFPALRVETGKASGGAHLARAFQLNDGSVMAQYSRTLPRIVMPITPLALVR
jgi:hypothetical protein